MKMILKNRLNAEDVRAVAERQLREHLSLKVEGGSGKIGTGSGAKGTSYSYPTDESTDSNTSRGH